MNNTRENTTTPQQRTSEGAREITPDDPRQISDNTSEGTPPLIKDAIDTIGEFSFDPEEDVRNQEQLNAAYMMLSAGGMMNQVALPTLQTEQWPHVGEKPNPVNLDTARRLLAAGYAVIPCELDGAGNHGYAWMIDTPEEWKARANVADCIQPPKKPSKGAATDLVARYVYMEAMNEYKVYAHLVQEGRNAIIKWYGKSMFLDLYQNRQLPVDITPRELLEYLAKTYANPRINRQYMESVRKSFNSSYDAKQPVETYFLRLQEVQYSAKILGEPFSDQQMINKAIQQFERAYGRDTIRKMETRWYEVPASSQQDWSTFKAFWKEEIHLYESLDGKGTKAANAAVVDTLVLYVETVLEHQNG